MKTGIIIYQSKYGATKKYAQWLGEQTGYPCTEVSKADIGEVSKYDTVVLCGGIYASGIAGITWRYCAWGRLLTIKTHLKTSKRTIFQTS